MFSFLNRTGLQKKNFIHSVKTIYKNVYKTVKDGYSGGSRGNVAFPEFQKPIETCPELYDTF